MSMIKKTELLAPAGNMECLQAAVMAGADAIYLAGKSFGARASAENFTDEELIEALDLAHIYNKKIYLTLNTLIKEREWKDIYGFVDPLYRAGLDGVIVQDIGLIGFLKKEFPSLPLHASTQMTITHTAGAEYVRKLGVCRIVTARELSLKEIKYIKENTGLEIEVFIHGAMCYSYSGACLFSSYLGGRSGNRGRCAGPCRLPYNGGEYPLSMRDMCLIDDMHELMDAGIDSFKIEGRLKNPEYVATVTSIYRKYMDKYYEGVVKRASDEDKSKLESLYLRGGYSTGYLHKHNGKDMISLDSPSYKTDRALRERKDYAADYKADIRLPVSIKAFFHVKQPMRLELIYDSDVSICVSGDEVTKAKNAPATVEDIKSRLGRMGNTPYAPASIDIELDDDCFIPVKSLNELRRMAVEKLTEARLAIIRDERSERGSASYVVNDGATITKRGSDSTLGITPERTSEGTPERTSESTHERTSEKAPERAPKSASGKAKALDISVTAREQLDAVVGLIKGGLTSDLTYKSIALYIPYDLIYSGTIMTKELAKIKESCGDMLIIAALPRIYRERSESYMKEFLAFIKEECCGGAGKQDMTLNRKGRLIDGILVKNAEQLQLIGCDDTLRDNVKIIADAGIYSWNAHSLATVLSDSDMAFVPYELSLHELEDMLTNGDGILSGVSADRIGMTVYGKAPLMVSANCVLKTYGKCSADKMGCGYTYIRDRQGRREPVYNNCLHCYNEIYNALPTSCHKYMADIDRLGIGRLRLDFTDETEEETGRVAAYYLSGCAGECPLGEYTTGHLQKGAI